MSIDDRKDAVVPMGFREVGDEVHGDCLPDTCWYFCWFGRYFDRGSYFACLACGTSFDVLLDELSDSWPVVFSCDEFDSFVLSWVSHYSVVEHGCDSSFEVLVVWDVDQALMVD